MQAPRAPLSRLEIPTLAFPTLGTPSQARASKVHARASARVTTPASQTKVRRARQPVQPQATPRRTAVRPLRVVKSSYSVAPRGDGRRRRGAEAGSVRERAGGGQRLRRRASGPRAKRGARDGDAAAGRSRRGARDAGRHGPRRALGEEYGYPTGATAARFMAMRSGDARDDLSEPAAEPVEAADAAPATDVPEASEPRPLQLLPTRSLRLRSRAQRRR